MDDCCKVSDCDHNRAHSISFKDAEPQIDRILNKPDIVGLAGVIHVHRCIGEGNVSRVYSASMEGLSEVAIKVFEFDRPSRVAIADLVGLSHPNLVRILRVINSQSCAVALDLCYCTLDAALHRKLEPGIGALDVIQQRLHASLDVVRGLSFLHARQIMHGDVSSQNCFLSQRPEFRQQKLPPVKLGDCLGVRLCDIGQVTRWSGTSIYMAPEVVTADRSTFHSTSADIYAYSILLYEIICRTRPFSHRPEAHAVLFALQGERPCLDRIPKPSNVQETSRNNLRRLMQQCWRVDAEARPHAIEVCWRLSNIATCWTPGFETEAVEEDAVPLWFVAYVSGRRTGVLQKQAS